MPHITKVLGNEVGIQFDRVKDNTGSTGTAPINGMIIGQFKRGRTDKPMIITSANLNATLGYDPDNSDFVAVQDALKTNIPYISVMRVVQENVDCTLLPSYVVLDSGDPFRELSKPYVLTVNGVNYQNEEDIIYYYAINNNPPELNGIFSMYVDSSGGSLYLQNRSDNCLYISDTEGLDIVLGVNLNA